MFLYKIVKSAFYIGKRLLLLLLLLLLYYYYYYYYHYYFGFVENKRFYHLIVCHKVHCSTWW